MSSQFISGLLFSLPLLDGDSVIEIIPPIESINYIKITIDVLKRFEESLSDIAEVEIQPKLEGRSMFMQLTPKK